MIRQINDQLARILDVLEGSRQIKNTVIIFTSDHGEMLGDHGLLYKGCRFYEGLVRLPLIFHWPKGIQAGLKSSALVELIDKSATILDLAEIPRPDHVQGRSLLPIMKGQCPPKHHRNFVRTEYYDALDASFLSRPRGSYSTMYRDDHYKLILYHGVGLGELYDLVKDPWEFDNLWGSLGHVDLRNRLLQACFDASILTGVDVGTQRIAPM